MTEPTLTFEVFSSETNEKRFISKMKFQHHSESEEIELFDYAYDKRDRWYSIPRGTINARQHVNCILQGVDPLGYIYSFAEQYALNNDIHANDQFIATFSGYGKIGGWCQIIDLGSFLKETEKENKSVIDDNDLLMQKFNAIQS